MAVFHWDPPLTGASNASGVGDSQSLSGSMASSCAVNGSTAKCNTLSCDEPWQVVDTGKRRRLFLTGDDDRVFMTKSQSTLRRRQTSSIYAVVNLKLK